MVTTGALTVVSAGVPAMVLAASAGQAVGQPFLVSGHSFVVAAFWAMTEMPSIRARTAIVPISFFIFAYLPKVLDAGVK